MRRCASRRGVALVSALSLLALLGLLVAGVVMSASLAERSMRASFVDGPLLGAADYAVGELLRDPAHFGVADLPLGQARGYSVGVPGAPSIDATVTATRLPGGIYWLVARASTVDGDSARRSINILARTAWIGPPPAAPFVARGPTSLAADVIVLPDTADEPDCRSTGPPPPSLATDDSVALFAEASQWASLATVPDVRLVEGDTTITSGAFEGILMVGGDLTVDGPFTMTGLIVARGRVRSHIGFHLTGAVVSHFGGPGAAIDLAGATVRFGPCLVARLLRGSSPLKAAGGWHWTELF